MPRPETTRSEGSGGSLALVWIDARRAIVMRLVDGEASIERVESSVPVHARAIGHVRHDPAIRHGGGRSQTAPDDHRLEHLARLVDAVVARLPAGSDVLIVGPGTVRERLARRVRALDRHAGRSRAITCRACAGMTDRQLVAVLRSAAGIPPTRRAVGTGGHVPR